MFRKKVVHQKSLQWDVVNAGFILNRKQIKNIVMKNKKGIGVVVLVVGEFECLIMEGKVCLCDGCRFRRG